MTDLWLALIQHLARGAIAECRGCVRAAARIEAEYGDWTSWRTALLICERLARLDDAAA